MAVSAAAKRALQASTVEVSYGDYGYSPTRNVAPKSRGWSDVDALVGPSSNLGKRAIDEIVGLGRAINSPSSEVAPGACACRQFQLLPEYFGGNQGAHLASCRSVPVHEAQSSGFVVAVYHFGEAGGPEVGAGELEVGDLSNLKVPSRDEHPTFGEVQHPTRSDVASGRRQCCG
jgi:hypothetical protein